MEKGGNGEQERDKKIKGGGVLVRGELERGELG